MALHVTFGRTPKYVRGALSVKATFKMATSKRHRTDLTLGQKLEIVSVMEREQPSQAELTKRFKSKIAKSKDAILKEAEKNNFATRKQKRASKDDDVTHTVLVVLVQYLYCYTLLNFTEQIWSTFSLTLLKF